MSNPGASSLDKALALLFAFAEPESSQRVFTVSALAEQQGMDKAQVSRALATFAKYGLVERLESRRGYQLGWSVIHLAGRALRAQTMSLIYPALSQLAVDLDETAHFSVRDGSQWVPLASFEPDRRLFVSVPVGRPAPLLGSGVGHALLARSDDEDLRSIFKKSERRTHPELRTWRDFQAQVQAVCADGYSIVSNERGDGITTAAVPIFDVGNYRGQVHAAIGISAPDERVAEQAEVFVERLTQVAGVANDFLRGREEDTG